MRMFQLGQRMDVTVISTISRQSYSVLIQDLDDTYFYVDYPGNIHLPHDKTAKHVVFLIQFFDTSGTPCSFETCDVSVTKHDGLLILRIKKPSKNLITRSQRREYARVSASFPLEILLDESLIPCRVHDISGGGISFDLHHTHSFHVGDKLLIRFAISLGQQVCSLEQDAIVRRIEASLGFLEYNHYGLEFHNIQEQNQNQIIRYVMNKQIERRERQLKAQKTM